MHSDKRPPTDSSSLQRYALPEAGINSSGRNELRIKLKDQQTGSIKRK